MEESSSSSLELFFLLSVVVAAFTGVAWCKKNREVQALRRRRAEDERVAEANRAARQQRYMHLQNNQDAVVQGHCEGLRQRRLQDMDRVLEQRQGPYLVGHREVAERNMPEVYEDDDVATQQAIYAAIAGPRDENAAFTKAMQDRQYEESLANDSARERAKQEDRRRRDEEQLQKAREEAMEDARREDMFKHLPKEPHSPKGSDTITVGLKTPAGKTCTRRFSSSDRLQDVRNYASALGFPESDYQITSPLPQDSLLLTNPDLSLRDCGLSGRVILCCKEKLVPQVLHFGN
eukprot:m.75874 g.75874  ORF g.75874 m.75874 type:complete len:291 (+) comp14613_c3_seq4:61-933(+)